MAIDPYGLEAVDFGCVKAAAKAFQDCIGRCDAVAFVVAVQGFIAGVACSASVVGAPVGIGVSVGFAVKAAIFREVCRIGCNREFNREIEKCRDSTVANFEGDHLD